MIAHKDRRIVARHPGTTIGAVRLRLNTGEALGSVVDISITGLAVLVKQPLKTGASFLPLKSGTCFVLEPSNPENRLSSELRAEICHSSIHDSEYLIGCRFQRLLTTDDILSLGHQD